MLMNFQMSVCPLFSSLVSLYQTITTLMNQLPDTCYQFEIDYGANQELVKGMLPQKRKKEPQHSLSLLSLLLWFN